IQINIGNALRSKLGDKARFVPRFAVRWLERAVHTDELNDMLRRFYPLTGADFCKAVMQDMDIELRVANPQSLPPRDDSRVIFVCNHPLGGLDGITLISLLSDIYGGGVKFVVNDLLMAVQPLQDVFLPINKHGKQSRKNAQDLAAAMNGDSPVLVFPAGLVSRLGADGKIRDLNWRKMFVVKAMQYHRDVVPLFFSGENSSGFYSMAKWRARLKIPFNIEMVRLPSEMLKARGGKFSLAVGDRIPWQSLAQEPAYKMASIIKEKTYLLKEKF
ncbi:MAG: 1-acyl-sn-glycerol-3-phosphate acyltransferase, partial [Lachnospiraceae bacterium]|nr:1-acyl-sn-glycerol-3-phosphate acyltransferase [Lachnospiraceae bacterium]